MKLTYWEFAGVYCYCTAAFCYDGVLKFLKYEICEKEKAPTPLRG